MFDRTLVVGEGSGDEIIDGLGEGVGVLGVVEGEISTDGEGEGIDTDGVGDFLGVLLGVGAADGVGVGVGGGVALTNGLVLSLFALALIASILTQTTNQVINNKNKIPNLIFISYLKSPPH